MRRVLVCAVLLACSSPKPTGVLDPVTITSVTPDSTANLGVLTVAGTHLDRVTAATLVDKATQAALSLVVGTANAAQVPLSLPSGFAVTGEPGAAYTLTLMTGSTVVATRDVTIIKGDKGDKGDQGDPGPSATFREVRLEPYGVPVIAGFAFNTSTVENTGPQTGYGHFFVLPPDLKPGGVWTLRTLADVLADNAPYSPGSITARVVCFAGAIEVGTALETAMDNSPSRGSATLPSVSTGSRIIKPISISFTAPPTAGQDWCVIAFTIAANPPAAAFKVGTIGTILRYEVTPP